MLRQMLEAFMKSNSFDMDRFMEEFECGGWTSDLEEYLHKTPSSNWILWAFCWNRTVEGVDYWERVHSMWLEWLSEDLG